MKRSKETYERRGWPFGQLFASPAHALPARLRSPHSCRLQLHALRRCFKDEIASGGVYSYEPN